MMHYLTLALLVLTVTGCSLHANPGRTKVSTGGVTVETDGGGPGHCPPGHAKKCWC